VHLFGLVVDLRHRRRHAVDAVVGAEKITGDVIIEAVYRAGVFGARLQRVVAAPIHRDQTAGGEEPVLCLNVDDTRCAEPVLRRQRTGDQGEGVGKTRAEALAEIAQPDRERYSVDAELHRLHLVADMNAARRLGVLAHTRRLQENLVERVVLAAGLRLDRLPVYRVDRGADLRLDRGPGRLEPLCHDVYLLELDRPGRRRGARRWWCRGRRRRASRRTGCGSDDRSEDQIGGNAISGLDRDRIRRCREPPFNPRD